MTDKETGESLGEVLRAGESLLVAKGGKRGYGNLSFLTSTRQAPTLVTEGKKGEERKISCELKVLADVGLAGFPNAGKSTLLGAISAAKPKVADYPFTTLHPQLGVVEPFGFSEKSFVVADIPGLLEGASQGKGLGHQFLRHLERTKVIVFLLDAFTLEDVDQVAKQFEVLRKELFQFSDTFAQKKQLVALNKSDLTSGAEHEKKLQNIFAKQGLPLFFLSAATGQGLSELIQSLAKVVEEEKDQD